MSDIGDLHNTLSKTKYDEILHIVLFKTDNELSEFVAYFERQWINSKFRNWQVFKTPVGFAMTKNGDNK